MARKRALSDVQEGELVAWWLCRRMNIADKAAAYGISASTLHNILSRHGVCQQGSKDKLIQRYLAEQARA